MVRHSVSVDGFARPLQLLLDALNGFLGVQCGSEAENGYRQETVNAHATKFKDFKAWAKSLIRSWSTANL